MHNKNLIRYITLILILPLLFDTSYSQKKGKNSQETEVRTMTIPISIRHKKPNKASKSKEFIEAGQIIVKEDKEEQKILSIRSVSNTPITLAVLIQDDLNSSVNLQLSNLKEFIRSLPKGSKVMVAYLRSGKTQTRQKFTKNLEKAAKSIRILVSNSSIAPRSPYDGVEHSLKKFDGQPAGRRAILLISDGLDVSNSSGLSSFSADLDKTILDAQKRGVAVYSFYSSATYTKNGNSTLILNGQGLLTRLSNQTGGRAFFHGTTNPVSFAPFFKGLREALNQQFALTYLSTHMNKGYHNLEVLSTNPEVKVIHPKRYYYKKRK